MNSRTLFSYYLRDPTKWRSPMANDLKRLRAMSLQLTAISYFLEVSMLRSLIKVFAMSLQLTALSLVFLTITGCSGGKMDSTNKVSFPSIKDIPAETWQKLSIQKIYFGHQSVGYNIIDGIKDVMRDNPSIKLQIVETSDPTALSEPIFAHSRVGKNSDPKSKIDGFALLMEQGLAEKADINFFKLCYVDITYATNVEQVFARYQDIMLALRKKYPKTTFVHVTTPLTTLQTGPKAWIKWIIGKPIAGVEDNIQREAYNQKLRNEYSGKEPVFDLAAIESTFPDGSRAVFEKNGKSYPRIVSEYTDDGGHLNEIGRKKVAEQLLILLAKTVNQ